MNALHPKLRKLKPAVPKSILLFLSGAMWTAVGMMLNISAFRWLEAVQTRQALLLFGIGVSVALVTAHFGFLRVVDKNLGRISRMDGKRCVFSFMSWKSYLNVVIMISMGFLLRHSPLPKPYLAIVYVAVGWALVLSSLRYYRMTMVELPTQFTARGSNSPDWIR